MSRSYWFQPNAFVFRSPAVLCLWGLLLTLALMAASPAALAQQRFRDRNYRVRIAVAHDVQQLVLRPSGSYQVMSSQGGTMCQLAGSAPYFIQITRGKPGQKVYRLVMHELASHQVDSAKNLAKAAKDAYGLPVLVLRLPGREPGTSSIIVTVGEFDTLEKARRKAEAIGTELITHIYEDRKRAQSGQVRLLDREGKILASDGEFLRLIPFDLAQSDLRVLKLEDDKWTWRELENARRYRGDMELAINKEGTLTAINDLWVEYYLYSVVGAEIGDDAPLEAMKAQAVAGRSEAVAKIQRGIVSDDLFDFYDTAIAQTYKGKSAESARTRQAVDMTRGEILVWHGEAVDAVYSHSCGGVMASSQDLWDGLNEGYAIRKLDRLGDNKCPDLSNGSDAHQWTAHKVESFCDPDQKGFPNYARKYFRWTKRMSGEEFSKYANACYGVGTVKDVDVTKRKGSGRVRELVIKGTKKTVRVTRELEIREALKDIYSTFFTILTDHNDDGTLRSVTVYGAGFGHGVGMCQMGAYMMALHGYNYRQILGHYYSQVKLRRLYR